MTLFISALDSLMTQLVFLLFNMEFIRLGKVEKSNGTLEYFLGLKETCGMVRVTSEVELTALMLGYTEHTKNRVGFTVGKAHVALVQLDSDADLCRFSEKTLHVAVGYRLKRRKIVLMRFVIYKSAGKMRDTGFSERNIRIKKCVKSFLPEPCANIYRVLALRVLGGYGVFSHVHVRCRYDNKSEIVVS